jgi:two-component system NtrC family response regulator
MQTILIVDDEKNYLVLLEALLGAEGYEVMTASAAQQALAVLRQSDVDLVITDMKMPGMSGMELLDECKKIKPEVPVITLTAYGTIEMAVEAMKKHAYDYITKPFQNEQLKLTVKKALEAHRLEKENRLLRQALSERFRHGGIIGKSRPMVRIYDMIDKIAQSKTTVLITGPSGTGKELIAKSIHYGSPRRDGPFITVNCGALAETLLESELFGHEKGAFTGAAAMKKGRFEAADGGTLFLDEVGDMPASLQVKLLRVLQEMAFERVGGTKTIKVDVRVISATNRDLKKEVAAGNFREDLFYRLNVINLEIPPLSERLDDIPLLVRHFIEKYGRPGEADKIEIGQDVLKIFYNYKWPGNVRELEHVIERALVLSGTGRITVEDLPQEMRGGRADFDIERFIPPDVPLHIALDTIEERMVRRALERCNNIQAHAAQMLGITKSLMQHKIKKYGIVI